MFRRVAIVVALAGVIITLPACDKGTKDGVPNKTFDSPQQVFDSAMAAAGKEDWATFMACLTEDSRDSFTGAMMIGAMMMKGFADDPAAPFQHAADYAELLATTPFAESDMAALRSDAPSVLRRLFPHYEALYAARGWRMFPSIDRTYVNRAGSGAGTLAVPHSSPGWILHLFPGHVNRGWPTSPVEWEPSPSCSAGRRSLKQDERHA